MCRRRLESACDVGDSEVTQGGLSEIGEQDVGGLDVSVQDADAMSRLESAGHLHPEAQHFVHGQRAEPPDAGFERTLSVVLHDEVWVAAVGFADL